MGTSVSFCKGKGSIAHNNRDFITPNVDKDRIKDNVTYKRQSLEDAYQQLFGAEVTRYNEAQKRADRRIKDYMEQIRTSKNGEKLFYENVVQVGTMYTCPVDSKDGKTAAKILDEYMKGFETRNPNLYVFNAVLHLDEQTPHLHIDYIPVARGYKNGLQIRNSLDKALCQQGCKPEEDKATKKLDFTNATQKWQVRERAELIAVMERHGLVYEAALETDRGNLTVDQYKAMVEEIDHRVEEMPEQIERKPAPLAKGKVIVSAEELDALEEKAKLLALRETVVGNLKEYRAEKRAEADEYLAGARTKEAYAIQHNQDAVREKLEARAEKEKYESLYEELGDLPAAYRDLQAENERQKRENASLRDEIAKLKESIANQIEAATEPLRAQIEQLREEARKKQEEFREKLRNMARGENNILAAIKYVATYFVGEVGGAVLNAVHRTGNRWLREDGFEDFAESKAWLPNSVAKELRMQLTFEDGPDGRGVYSPAGTCVANMDTIKEAREAFPNCEIQDKTISKVNEQQKSKSRSQPTR